MSGRIEAGDDWRDEIERSIEKADNAILLISGEFLTSKFIPDEEIGVFLARRHKDACALFRSL
ncbi:MAG: TIR domain-containing protein [Geminicoccales bacterium]